ncbi:hypothetical protein ETAE_1147 [Edwardsiella piscicida]|uniref:Uncharacterized protein n=1 Tax=Edwardsiella piscicida TaxID=1263550 RepID=A0AAU8P642_EDWPI|nr:hypothetical protein ETAE_1147 [Edwardsiella tarda EIB202]
MRCRFKNAHLNRVQHNKFPESVFLSIKYFSDDRLNCR